MLEYCVRYNRSQQCLGAAVACFFGWTCLVDLICSETPLPFFNHEIQLAFLVELLLSLLGKLEEFDTIDQVREGVAQSTLRLTGGIRELFLDCGELNEPKYLQAMIKPFQMLLDYVVRPGRFLLIFCFTLAGRHFNFCKFENSLCETIFKLLKSKLSVYSTVQLQGCDLPM